MTTVEEVKEALGIDSFHNLSKNKIIEFVYVIPHMDKDVAISIINQFPAYAESTTNMVTQLKELCDNVIEKNGDSQKETIAAYRQVLDYLGTLLLKENISAEERADITKQLVEIADKIPAKDSENKELKYSGSTIGGALLLGAVILGVNVKGTELSILSKKVEGEVMEQNTINTETNDVPMRIASINLNGETWNLNNKKPRLPKDVFDIESIKNSMTYRVKNGLSKLLDTKQYDIIAIQELVNIRKYREEIETVINSHGYKLIVPTKLTPRTHFTIGFIVKEGICVYTPEIEIENHNKQIAIDCAFKGIKFTLLNLHITNDYEKIKDIISKYKEKRIIFLGDMNAYTIEQIETGGKESNHADFIMDFMKYGFSGDTSNNKNYTYLTGNKWRKLDHVFLSKELNNDVASFSETKDDTVNFYSDTVNGFTDHSMLMLEINFK